MIEKQQIEMHNYIPWWAIMSHSYGLVGIMQLRPTCSYFDKQDKKKNEKNKTDNSDEEEKEPEAQQVTVKFARLETEVAKKAREKSYETLSKKVNAEPWYNSYWKPSDSDHADVSISLIVIIGIDFGGIELIKAT